jgi:hypothetical protein
MNYQQNDSIWTFKLNSFARSNDSRQKWNRHKEMEMSGNNKNEGRYRYYDWYYF